MENKNLLKNKHMTDTEIEIYCQSVDELLIKIKDRCDVKGNKKKKEEDVMTLEEEQLTAVK